MPYTLVNYSYWKFLGDKRCSEMRATYRDGFVTFTGGRNGGHRIQATDAKSVNAHWLGYVENNAKKGSVPARITARKLAEAVAAAQVVEATA